MAGPFRLLSIALVAVLLGSVAADGHLREQYGSLRSSLLEYLQQGNDQLRALPSSFAALQTSRQTIPALAVSRPPLALHPHVGPHPARVALLALRLMSSHLCPLSP